MVATSRFGELARQLDRGPARPGPRSLRRGWSRTPCESASASGSVNLLQLLVQPQQVQQSVLQRHASSLRRTEFSEQPASMTMSKSDPGFWRFAR